MKMKHNKKRNTAFIFEVLIRELTKSIVEKNDKQKKIIISLIKENFKNKSLSSIDCIQAMIDYPKLMERPILIINDKAVIGRPPEKIFDLIKSK